MSSKNSKTFYYHRLLLNLTDKINLRRSPNMFLYQILQYYTWRNIKSHIRTRNLKYQLHHYFEYMLKNMDKRLLILQ